MGRCSSIVSSQVAAVALLLLICFSHRAAAARPLPAAAAAADVPALVHHANGVKAAASSDGLVLQEGAGASTNGEELSISEMMGAETTEEAACEEGIDECLQRRLLHDAHLDYIYTQHKGKP